MRLLFRVAFWLGIVIVLLPSPILPPASPPSAPQSAAKSAGADPREVCPRRLEACTEHLQAFAKLGRDFYRRLAEGGAQRGNKFGREGSSDTLTTADLKAPWRGSPARATAAQTSSTGVH